MKYKTATKLLKIKELIKELSEITPVVIELIKIFDNAETEQVKENIGVILATKSGKEYMILKCLEHELCIYIKMLLSENEDLSQEIEYAKSKLDDVKTKINIIEVQRKTKRPCVLDGKVSDEKMQELVALHTRKKTKQKRNIGNEYE